MYWLEHTDGQKSLRPSCRSLALRAKIRHCHGRFTLQDQHASETSGAAGGDLWCDQGNDNWQTRHALDRFARFDSQATWLDELQPAFGEDRFFFDPYIRAMYEGRWQPEWAGCGDEDEELTA